METNSFIFEGTSIEKARDTDGGVPVKTHREKGRDGRALTISKTREEESRGKRTTGEWHRFSRRQSDNQGPGGSIRSVVIR
jgi:hypothetical protein